MIKIRETILNKIGQLTDFVHVPFVSGASTILGHLNTNYYHVHGQSFVYPTAADNVELTAAAGAWAASGDIIEVIPGNTLSVSEFDLHWINISTISENAELEIRIFKGAPLEEVQISATRPSRTAAKSQEGARRIQIPQQPKNTRISCQLLSSTLNATTCKVSFEGHYYA